MICRNCHKEFDRPKLCKTTSEAMYGVAGDFGSRTPVTIEVCPYCDDDDIEDGEKDGQ